MAKIKVLARDWNFEINTGTSGAPVWERIKGINSFSFDPSKSDADATDFDNGGWGSHLVASRTISMTLDGQRIEDPADGSRDPGQEAVEALAEEIGVTSIGEFRFYNKNSLKGKQFNASANVTGPGGGNDDLASWSVELTVDGKPTPITVIP